MKKRTIFKTILLVIIVLLLVFGGVFWWRSGKEVKGSPDDYVIKETEEGRMVENERARLRVKVPEGWEIEKIEVEEGSVIFYSPDAEGVRPDRIRPPLRKGCVIEIAVAYKKMDFEEIKREIEEGHKTLAMKSDEFGTVELNGRSALKNTFDCVDLGPTIDVYIPGEYILYGLGITTAPQDTETCFQEFDKFLETVSIE